MNGCEVRGVRGVRGTKRDQAVRGRPSHCLAPRRRPPHTLVRPHGARARPPLSPSLLHRCPPSMDENERGNGGERGRHRAGATAATHRARRIRFVRVVRPRIVHHPGWPATLTRRLPGGTIAHDARRSHETGGGSVRWVRGRAAVPGVCGCRVPWAMGSRTTIGHAHHSAREAADASIACWGCGGCGVRHAHPSQARRRSSPCWPWWVPRAAWAYRARPASR